MTVTPSGRRVVRSGNDLLVLTRTFRAPIEDVWAAVTVPVRLARWFGTWSGDPKSGTVQVRMQAEGDVPEQSWTILECSPKTRLSVRAGESSETWDFAVELSKQAGTTILEFTQAIDDPSGWESIGPGWEYYLDRLVVAESGGDPSTVDFERDYYPALGPYYANLTAAPK
ncbi:SRPBCC family protein [Dietzia alimentaria]|uniref:SRPBCC family protein n=1 Tax=Dietzia alimentaria TaxID=665550 RepID=UPI00029AA8D4|nr:SRPBCC family protein [Dietzia alimentaria]